MNSKPDKLEPSFFHRSPLNLLRITSVRVLVQTVSFAMFLAFVYLATYAQLNEHPGLRLWVSKVLEIDPLVSLATALTTHTVYQGLLWSLIIVIPTLLLGRFFCGWICPFGAMHQFTHWLLGGYRRKERIDANQYRPLFAFKYYLLTALLVAAVFGSLQIGLLDPICLIYRSFTGAVMPAASVPLPQLFGDRMFNQGAWLVGGLLFLFLALNLVIPRFFCRALCPLGALLGVFSRFGWWRIERDRAKCDACNLCSLNCEAACDPHKDLRKSECFVCYNCIEDCPCGALSFKFLPPREHEIAAPDVSRRKVVFAAAAGLAFPPLTRTTGRTTRNFSSTVVRPPGTVEELEFLERCLKCAQCIRACPTGVLQPAWFEAGLEGLWTPVMNFRIGHCQLNCTACGQVCPTGAIQRLTLERKLGVGQYAAQGPIKLGTAHFDTGRCLPYSKNTPCVVCEEVCPTSPKAIFTERQMRTVRDGRLQVREATENTLTVVQWPRAGRTAGEPVSWAAGRFAGDETTTYHVQINHPDAATEIHRIAGNQAASLTIEGRFLKTPTAGTAAVLKMEYKVPLVDTELCIGCGLCERECPVVGDRRAVYVTAEGETRSHLHEDRDRDRSLRLLKRG